MLRYTRKETMRQEFPLEIINRVKNGDTAAFSVMVDRFQTSVYNLCYRMLSYNVRDAEDAAQEVFVKIWTNIKQFNAQRTFST